MQEPKLWYGIGILYDRYGSLDHAEEAFSQVMRMAPTFDKANEIYFRLGIIYKQQSKFEESLQVCREQALTLQYPCTDMSLVLQVHRQHSSYSSQSNRHLVPDRPRVRTAEEV